MTKLCFLKDFFWVSVGFVGLVDLDFERVEAGEFAQSAGFGNWDIAELALRVNLE
jgi:hypothetical protein